MAKRPIKTTQEYLVNAPLPEQTETYTVISHQTVIDGTKKTIEAMGFEIDREFYRCNEGAQVATGIYHLKYGDDSDIGMLFAWANSYDKSMRFQCSVGGYVHESLVSFIGGNMGSWGRKHTGEAKTEALDTIQNQLVNAEEYFKELILQKEKMKTIPVSHAKRAEFLGKVYFENDLLTTEQLSIVKQEFTKPSHFVSGIDNSLWQMYHAVLVALQKSHPKTWMEQQRLLHSLVSAEFLTVNKQDSVSTVNEPVVISNQLDLVEVIKEIEQEMVEDIAPADVQVDITVEHPVEEDGWPCVQCGKMQGPNDVWHDGQLCSACVNQD